MPSLLADLRSLVPARPLGVTESFHLAEVQAQRLLARQLSEKEWPVPDTVMADVPRIRVTRQSHIPISGSSHWAQGVWAITVNADEPKVRQRFTMAHELKHVLDAPADPKLLYPAVRTQSAKDRIEQVCDFFAACVLMPRPWVKQAWREGNQTPAGLARTFNVSQVAMRRRLVALGLYETQPRCEAE
ncbi:MAG: ImmA/IrrE family metallo-endopeptidase [Acidimicrobiales bacterium]